MLPGGIGVAEAEMTGMFAKLGGLSWSLSVALTFVIRLVTLWFATLVGVVGLLVVRRVIGEPLAEPVEAAAAEAQARTSPEP